MPPLSKEVIAGALDDAELGAPYLADLVFNWPSDCTVPVVEEVLKAGSTALLSYNLGLKSQGKNNLVTFDDLAVTSFDGNPPSDETAKAVEAQFILPGFLVGPDGKVIELIGLEVMIEQIEALDPSLSVELTPELVALLHESIIDKYWGSWVGAWANWGYFDTATEHGTSELRIGGDVAISDVEMKSLGVVDDSLAVLRSTITLDGADFALAMRSVVDIAIDPAGASQFTGQRVITVEVVTDPATLRPMTAFTSIAIELTVDGETRSELEERRWRLDWDACG